MVTTVLAILAARVVFVCCAYVAGKLADAIVGI
jgi:hypothetical protein